MTREEIIKKAYGFRGANREFSQEMGPLVEAILEHGGAEVVDSLESNSPTKALSARQGKELNVKKQDAPATAGTPGQVLQLDANGKPKWVDAAEGGTYDSEMSDSSTNAVQNKVIKSYADTKAEKDGNYPLMSVGMAKNLDGNLTTNGAFMERIVAGSDDADISNGVAQLIGVKGRSVKFNQLTDLGTTTENQGLVKTIINQCTIRVQGTPTTQYPTLLGAGDTQGVNVIEGHKYYSSAVLISGTLPEGVKICSYSGSFREASVDTGAKIRTAASDSNGARWNLDCGNDYAEIELDATFVLQVHDITDIFGAGDESETTAEFEAWLAQNVGKQPWFPWTAGTILNVGMEGVEATGFNLFNPETGKATIIGAYSSLYGNYYGIIGSYTSLAFTDIYGRTSSVSPDSDGKFQLTIPGELTVTGADDDTAVFLWWDGSRTGYAHYNKSGAYLDVKHINGKQDGTGTLESVFAGGMNGFGSNYDKLDVEGATVVIGSRAYEEGDESDATVLTDGTNTLYVLDTPKFYPASSLVYVGSDYHEDNTPVTIPANYEVDNWGIEQIVPANSGALNTAAPLVTCKYSPDVLEIVDTHTEEIAYHEERLDNIEENMVTPEMYCPTLGAGTADDFRGSQEATAQYLYRETNGGSPVGNSVREMVKIGGESVEWNQLFTNPNFDESDATAWRFDDGTKTYENNTLKCELTGSANTIGIIKSGLSIPANHKVYACFDLLHSVASLQNVRFDMQGNGDDARFVVTDSRAATADTWATYAGICTNNVDTTFVNIGVKKSGMLSGDYIILRNAVLIDLTLMGYPNIATVTPTVQQVEDWLRKTVGLKDYYDYNDGSLINSRLAGVESTGYNWLDVNGTRGVAKLIGGIAYTISGTFTSAKISNVDVTLDQTGSFTPTADAELVVLGCDTTTVVRKTSAAVRTGDQPFKRNSKAFDVCTLTGINSVTGERELIAPDGLCKLGDNQDVMQFHGGQLVCYKPLSMRAYESGDESDAAVLTDKTHTLYILDQPITYTKLQDANGNPVTTLPAIPVDKDGTESTLPQNLNGIVSVAPELTCIYSLAAKDSIIKFNEGGICTTDNKAQATAILEALKTAGIIASYTIGDTPTNKVYPVTVTAPSV